MASRAADALWLDRLSMTMMSPDDSSGTSTWRIFLTDIGDEGIATDRTVEHDPRHPAGAAQTGG